MQILCAYAAPIEAGPLPGEGLAVEFLELGVGKTAATHSMTLRLAESTPDLVVLFGIGGAYRDHDLKGSELCLITEDRLADEGVATETGFLDLDELSLGTNGPFEMSPQHTDRVASLLGIERLVHGATVSTCSGTQSRAEGIAAQSGAQIESMEGAAVAFACRQADVPLVQLRCVSNFAGDRAEGSWDIEGSTTILQSAVRQLARGLAP